MPQRSDHTLVQPLATSRIRRNRSQPVSSIVALRHEGAQLETAGKTAPGRQAEIVDHDRDIVLGVEPDVARLIGLRRRNCRHEILVGVRLPNAAPVRTNIGRFGEYMKFTQLISWLLSASERGSAIVSKPADALASLPRKAEDKSQR